MNSKVIGMLIAFVIALVTITVVAEASVLFAVARFVWNAVTK